MYHLKFINISFDLPFLLKRVDPFNFSYDVALPLLASLPFLSFFSPSLPFYSYLLTLLQSNYRLWHFQKYTYFNVTNSSISRSCRLSKYFFSLSHIIPTHCQSPRSFFYLPKSSTFLHFASQLSCKTTFYSR